MNKQKAIDVLNSMLDCIKNCGTGSGGFKPGNSCNGGGGSAVAEHVTISLADIRSEAEDYEDQVSALSPGRYANNVDTILVEVSDKGRVDILDGFHRAAGLLRWANENDKDIGDIKIEVINVRNSDLAKRAEVPGPQQQSAIDEIYASLEN